MASDMPPPPDPLPDGWPINSTHLTRLITDPEYALRKVNKKMELAILERLWGDYMNRNRPAVWLSMFDEAQGMSEKAAEQHDQQSNDEKPLLQIDWSPENRRIPTQRKFLPVYNVETDVDINFNSTHRGTKETSQDSNDRLE
jgi:hypothetical protein